MNGDMVKVEDQNYIVKVRGLPYSATSHDVALFFSGCDIKGGKSEGVHFCFNPQSGKPTGECFVEFISAPDMRKALLQHHRYLGRRYLEVEKCSEDVMRQTLKTHGETVRKSHPIVRLRGLPFKTTDTEIEKLFSGLTIDKLVIVKDPKGQAAGDGYVQFEKESDMKDALNRHMEKIGHRYIEVFQAYNVTDLDDMPKNRPSKPNKVYHHEIFKRYFPSSPGYNVYEQDWNNHPRITPRPYHTLRMRGLPFEASEQEIAEFFEPITPVHVQLIYTRQGRPSGEAEVSFGSYSDLTTAMTKDKEYLGNRYVELFNETGPQAPGNGGYLQSPHNPPYYPRGYSGPPRPTATRMSNNRRYYDH